MKENKINYYNTDDEIQFQKLDEFRKFEPKLTNDVLKVFDLKNSVNSKKSYGGTSFDNIKKMIRKYRKLR